MTQMYRILGLTGNSGLNGQERLKLPVMEVLKALGCQISAKFNVCPAFRALPKEFAKDEVSYLEALTAGADLECNLGFMALDRLRMVQFDPKWHIVGSAANWSRRSTQSIRRETE
jgi:hypothetical protein